MSPSFNAWRRFELFNFETSVGFLMNTFGSVGLKSRSRSRLSSMSLILAFASPTDVSDYFKATSLALIPSLFTGLWLGGDLEGDLLWLLVCFLEAVSFSYRWANSGLEALSSLSNFFFERLNFDCWFYSFRAVSWIVWLIFGVPNSGDSLWTGLSCLTCSEFERFSCLVISDLGRSCCTFGFYLPVVFIS